MIIQMLVRGSEEHAADMLSFKNDNEIQKSKLTIYFNFSDRNRPFRFHDHAPSIAGDHGRVR